MKNGLIPSTIALASLLSTSIALAGSSVLTEDIIAQRLSFETANDYQNWQSFNSQLSTSPHHFKDGKQALRWQWQTGGKLVMDQLPGLEDIARGYPGGTPEQFEPSYYGPGLHGGIKLWVYRETPHPTGHLSFKIARSADALNDDPKYQFSMNQNFTGWRAIWVNFEEDAKVSDYSGGHDMRSLSIEPSKDMTEGDIYFDLLQFVHFVSAKRHSDNQFINKKAANRVDSYEIKQPWDTFQTSFSTQLDNVTAQEIHSVQQIEQRLEHLITGAGSSQLSTIKQGTEFNHTFREKIKSAQTFYQSLNIKREGGHITGVPLFSSRDEQPGDHRYTYQDVSQNAFFYLAMDYRLADASEKPEKLKKLFDLFDYFADQGWAAGSAMGTVDHLIRISGYATGVFLMRDELEATGRLSAHREALSWYTRMGSLVNLDISKGESPDAIRGGLVAKVISVLLMPDSPEKMAQMKLLQEYFTHITEFSPGYSGGIKPDYSLFHHRGAYMNAYGVQALVISAMAHWLTADTAFSLPADNIERLYKTFLAQTDFAAEFQIHPGAGGRFPYKNSGIDRFMLPGYAFMGLTEKDPESEISSVFARAYEQADLRSLQANMLPGLTYFGSFGTLSLMEQLYQQHKNRIVPIEDGTYGYPYAGILTHKHKDWVASVRGTSKYVWDFESGNSKNENMLGRYLAFGSLMLFSKGSPLSLEASGIALNNGFHWGYMPGATTKAMPIENVSYPGITTEKYVEGKHRNFTENTFLGSLTFTPNSGIFAMDFRDTVTPDDEKTLFDDSFVFKKSFFFFADEIVALGSGIGNNDARFDTITTLFQSNTAVEPSSVNGELVHQNMQAQYSGGVFGDPQGNYYVVPENFTVDFVKGEQTTLQKKDKQVSSTKTKFANYGKISRPVEKAFINHGSSPINQGYEYLLLPQSDLAVAIQHKKDKGYQVLQKDSKAHIVHHNGAGQTGYALFEAGNVHHGPILSVDTPMLVMTQESLDILTISLADPDLRLKKWNHNMSRMPEDIVHAEASDHIASLQIRGEWKVVSGTTDLMEVSHDAGNTTITIKLNHGLSRSLILEEVR